MEKTTHSTVDKSDPPVRVSKKNADMQLFEACRGGLSMPGGGSAKTPRDSAEAWIAVGASVRRCEKRHGNLISKVLYNCVPRLPITLLLLQNGANPNSAPSGTYDPLPLARLICSNGPEQTLLVQALLDFGADWNVAALPNQSESHPCSIVELARKQQLDTPCAPAALVICAAEASTLCESTKPCEPTARSEAKKQRPSV